MPILKEKGIDIQLDKVEKVCSMIKERATFISDFWDLSSYFFVAPLGFEDKAVKKFWKGDNPKLVSALGDLLSGIADFSAVNCEKIVHDWITDNSYPMGQVMNSFRLSVVGASMGPSMFDIIEIIGKQETIKRIEYAVKTIKTE